MNYVEHNLGDYAKDTKGLTPTQHGVYRLLLDEYYVHEHELSLDERDLMNTIGCKSKPEREAVKFVLGKFFRRTEAGWWHKRCDEEIAKYKERSSKARASAGKRWGIMPTQCEGNANADANALPTQCEGNASRAMLPPPTSHTPPPRKKNKDNAPAALSASDLEAEGIPIDVAKQWLQVRREKGAKTLSPLAWEGVKSEAEKAGWPIEDAVRKSIARNWVGFEAKWVSDEPSPSRSNLVVNAAGQVTIGGFVP